ncbi:hypothetical protein SRHO_G00316840 [Serrasalmus rhombeus]
MAKQRQRWHLAANSTMEEEDEDSDQSWKPQLNRGIKDIRSWEMKSTGNEDEMRADQHSLMSIHSDLITQSPHGGSGQALDLMDPSNWLPLSVPIIEPCADIGLCPVVTPVYEARNGLLVTIISLVVMLAGADRAKEVLMGHALTAAAPVTACFGHP